MLGHRVLAPSTVGAFLRCFTFGHTRQLDRLAEQILGRAWAAGAGPGDGPMTIDADSTIVEVHGHHEQGAAFGYTRRLGYHPLLACRADTGEMLHARRKARPRVTRLRAWPSRWPRSHRTASPELLALAMLRQH